MSTTLIVIHLILSIGLVGLILIQHGKGADMGTAFGAGASSGSVFGSSGAGNFLSRSTAILAGLFFLTSLALAYVAMQSGQQTSLMDGIETPTAATEQRVVPTTDLPVVPAESPTMSTDDIPTVNK